MINIAYQRLFNLKVSHDYYINGLAKGVHLIPTKETIALLKNSKMLLKHLAHQMVVLYRGLNEVPPVDPSNPFIPINGDFRFTFAITAENKPEFINITNLDVGATSKYQSGNILYFINAPANATNDKANPENLNYSLLDSIQNSVFTYEFRLNPIPPNPHIVNLVVRPINDNGTLGTSVSVGKEVDGTPLPVPLPLSIDSNKEGYYNQSIDLRNRKSGRYRIQIEHPLNSGIFLLERDIYVRNELASKSILGIVDIIYQPLTAFKLTEEYNIQFTRKKSFWKYYLVPKSSKDDLSTYAIEDLVPGTPENTPYVNIDFSNDVTLPDEKINGKKIKVLRSDKAIDFFEKPKFRIELNGAAGKIKIENLPNASPGSILKRNKTTSELESDIYVFL